MKKVYSIKFFGTSGLLAFMFGMSIFSVAAATESVTWTDTTDADFSEATLVQTKVQGSSEQANVRLSLGAAEWQTIASPVSVVLTGVDASSATNAWAVGDSGTILRWNGTSWTTATSGTANTLWSVAALSTTNAWAVGDNGTILRWNGTSWVSVASPTTEHLLAVTMVTANDGWIVGENGTILRWNGASWTTIVSPTVEYLYAVTLRSAGDGWIVGGSGTILRWDGAAWSAVSSSTTNTLLGVAFLDVNMAIAVGEAGTLLRWDGAAWSAVSSDVSETLTTIAMISATDGWIAGENGVLLKTSNGTSWTNAVSPTSDAFSRVALTASDAGWVVGASGAILQLQSSYAASGTVTGKARDAGGVIASASLVWNATTPFGTEVKLQLASNDDNATWKYVGHDGTDQSYFTTAPGTDLGAPHKSKHYLRYRAFLTTSDTGVTPFLDDVTLTATVEHGSAPSTPTLATPAERTTIITLPLTFTWSVSADATSYDVQMDTKKQFLAPVATATVSDPSYTHDKVFADGVYFWRVRAVNAFGTSVWSAIRTFTVDRTPPAVPTNLLPLDAATVPSVMPSFTWDAIADAIAYEFQLNTSDKFIFSSLVSKTLSEPTYTVTQQQALTVGATYYWRVRSRDSVGNRSAWVTTRKFTVVPPSEEQREEQKKLEEEKVEEKKGEQAKGTVQEQPITEQQKVFTRETQTQGGEPALTTEQPSATSSSSDVSSSSGGSGEGGGGVVEALTFPLTLTSPKLLNTNQPMFVGTIGRQSAIAAIQVDGQTVGTTAVDDSGAFTFVLPIRLPDGEHAVRLVVAGIASLPESFTIDTTPPTLPTTVKVEVVRQRPSLLNAEAGDLFIAVTGTIDSSIVEVAVTDAHTTEILGKVIPFANVLRMSFERTAQPRGISYVLVAFRDAAGNFSFFPSSYEVTDAIISYECSDGKDNDGDELVDYLHDPNCESLTDNQEQGTFIATVLNSAVVSNVTTTITNATTATVQATKDVSKKVAKKTVEQTVIIAQATEKAVEAAAPIAVPTLTATAPIMIAVNPATASSLPALPNMAGQGFSWLLSVLGIRKKRKNPWGVVYDAITKDPIGLAIIRLFDATPITNPPAGGVVTGQAPQLLATQVTDKEGRFEFLVKPGTYTLGIVKTPYVFPSTLVSGKTDDALLDVYHGEPITITSETQNIHVSIPLDPEDPSKRLIAGFHATIERARRILARFSLPLLVAGTAFSIILYAFAQTQYNLLMLLAYVVLAAYQTSILPKAVAAFGTIFDAITLQPVPLALVHIVDPQYQRILKSRLSDYRGRFTFLPDPGNYELRVVKQGYQFPSAHAPAIYHRRPVYAGGAIVVEKKKPIIAVDIALDAVAGAKLSAPPIPVKPQTPTPSPLVSATAPFEPSVAALPALSPAHEPLLLPAGARFLWFQDHWRSVMIALIASAVVIGTGIVIAKKMRTSVSIPEIITDQDGDGLSDQEETERKTDPTNADTDGDGYPDGVEVQSGYNPLGAGRL